MTKIDINNNYWVMDSMPKDNNFFECFKLLKEKSIEVPEGFILTKNIFLSMDAGTRMIMTDREDSYLPPTPIGEKITGTVLSEVVVSKNPGFLPGQKLRSWGQWADYSLIDPESMFPSIVNDTEIDLINYVGILGANGWTAYVGVVETGRAKKGDDFVVSAAAGCTGLLVGQIAKIVGCKVIGIAGTDEKCKLICDSYGFDGAINYKKENVSDQLKELCPEGINVYVDHVGGPIAEAVYENMALFGTLAISGLLDYYSSSKRSPGPKNYDLILMKRLRVEGFFSPDFYHRENEFNPLLKNWIAEKKIKLPFQTTKGLENLPEAYLKLFEGGNIGKVVVEV